MFAWQALRPEFSPQNPHRKARGGGAFCNARCSGGRYRRIPGLEAVLIHRTTIALYKSGQTIEFLCHSHISLQDEGITYFMLFSYIFRVDNMEHLFYRNSKTETLAYWS